jgi:hypothetical protein
VLESLLGRMTVPAAMAARFRVLPMFASAPSIAIRRSAPLSPEFTAERSGAQRPTPSLDAEARALAGVARASAGDDEQKRSARLLLPDERSRLRLLA